MHEDFRMLADLVKHAKAHETEQKLWNEWLAFAPLASLGSQKIITFQDYKGEPQSAAVKGTDKDIEEIRAFIQRDMERGAN